MATKSQSPKASETLIKINGIERAALPLWIEGEELLTNRLGGIKLAEMRAKQEAGTQPKGTKKGTKAPKDFSSLCQGATYRSAEGWYGIKTSAIRNAMMAAAPLLGFSSVMANVSIWVLPDGRDKDDGTPLVRIHADAPEDYVVPAWNRYGYGGKVIDLRARPRFSNWRMRPVIQFNAKVFTAEEIANLLNHAGLIGIGDGRPGSPNSFGIGMGMFSIVQTPVPVNAGKRSRTA